MPSLPDSPFFLAPLPAAVFHADYLEREVLALHRANPAFFREQIDLAHIDELVTAVRIPPTNLNLAQDDTPLPLEDYCVGGNYVDKARVLALHRAGATIILRAVEQWSPRINRVRIVAEEFFGCPCQVNVYITPPSQKSTPPHWDTHDLVVMQIEGAKRWRLFRGARTLPLGDERFSIDQDAVGPAIQTIELSAGDTLYLPRGVIHEPVAETYSVHASIGIHTLRWQEVAELALRLAAEREGSALRTAVAGAGGRIGCIEADELAATLDGELLERARAIQRRRFEATRAVDLQGALVDFACETRREELSRERAPMLEVA
jgi:ribosomal protein L16 Arg81 hydroxylase